MRIYHNQLVQRIDELGSNGNVLFPFEKLEWHMKKYSKFGLGKSEDPSISLRNSFPYLITNHLNFLCFLK